MRSAKHESVVLIPGLWQPASALFLLRKRMEACGFQAHVFSYPSIRCNLKENAKGLDRYLKRLDAETIHLVGHSLGGLVIRALFHFFPDQRPGRIVTLATPHLGAQSGAVFRRSRLGRLLAGRGVKQLVEGIPQHWAVPDREIGVIAGNVSIGVGMAISGVPKPNDGVIAVAETRLPEAADHLTLPVAHTAIVLSVEVARQTCCFLKTGSFQR